MIVALEGGVGGAKMADGLSRAAGPQSLAVVVNTADDFDLYGLRICPDLDTVLYTLAGIANPETGWGVAGDTRATLDAIARYGEEPWFLLGDQDFATHILRTAALAEKATLTEVIARLAAALGVRERILPMTDDSIRTIIGTADGELAFQDYFVARRQADEVTGVRFEGIESAEMTPRVREAIAGAELIVLCPSNPIVSIGPMVALPGLREAIIKAPAPVVAVSPLVNGRALKGPADRMLRSLGHEPSAFGVAKLYAGLVDGFVIDTSDDDLSEEIVQLGMRVLVTDAVMHDSADRGRLAAEVLEFGRSLVRVPA